MINKKEIETLTINLFNRVKINGFNEELSNKFKDLLIIYLQSKEVGYKSVSYMYALCYMYIIACSDFNILLLINKIKNKFIIGLSN